MARRIRIDRGFESRLEEFEQAIFQLKIEYDRYFNGFERIEPQADRDRARRTLLELELDCPNNTAQAHKLRSLKARFSAYELYWQRNLVQIERGTHPKFKFRAGLKERERLAHEDAARKEAAAREQQDRARREDKAWKTIFDSYLEARRSCGQSTEVPFEAVRDTLKKQVAAIKEKTGCKSVKFRVAVEDGKAKVKAIPVT
ncbi:hypothetical protein L6R53_15495 [Myxococcota bacterium]|nr:hypothetical protein [Myxococcota bacterium]